MRSRSWEVKVVLVLLVKVKVISVLLVKVKVLGGRDPINGSIPIR